MKEIYCDECLNMFVPKIKKRWIKKGLSERFFKCDQCGKEYHVIFIDDNQIRIKKQIDKLKRRIKKNQNNEFIINRDMRAIAVLKSTARVNQERIARELGINGK